MLLQWENYDDKIKALYSSDMKRMWLETYDNVPTRVVHLDFLAPCSNFEREWDKDLSEFNYENIESLLESRGFVSTSRARNFVSTLSLYTDYLIKAGYCLTPNFYRLFPDRELRRLVSDRALRNRFLTKESYNKVLATLMYEHNYVKGAILVLLYNCVKCFSDAENELGAVKKSDFKDNVVRIGEREITLTRRESIVLARSMYQSDDPDTGRDLADSDYLVRPLARTRTEGPIRYAKCLAIIEDKIRITAENGSLTPMIIYLSGLFYKLIDLLESRDDNIDDFMRRYVSKKGNNKLNANYHEVVEELMLLIDLPYTKASMKRIIDSLYDSYTLATSKK